MSVTQRFTATLLACAAVLLALTASSLPRASAHAGADLRMDTLHVAIDPALSVLASPFVLTSLLQNVSISWSGNFNGQAFDWIAAYSPPPSSLDGFLATLPVKYFNLTEAAGPGAQGSIRMELLHMRAPWVFAYMRGQYNSPTLVSVSNVLSYSDELANAPMQLHLARTLEADEMSITWTTTNASAPMAVWNDAPFTDPAEAQFKAPAATATYTRDQMCGDMAAGAGWREPGSIHTALMTGLISGRQYWYAVGDGVSGSFSPVHSFFAPPPLGADVDMHIYGDLGQGQLDGTIGRDVWKGKAEHSDQPAAIDTLRALEADLIDGSVNNVTALNLFIGDISYARGREALWEQFHMLLEPVSTRVGLMTLPGNHEVGWAQSYIPGTDSGGECGVAHLTRFPLPDAASRARNGRMPTADQARPWYSFNHGAAHVVMISTEHDPQPGSEQYMWLEADLAAVERSLTPWVIVNGHRPMYVSSSDAKGPKSDMGMAATIREAIEPLLNKYEVDLFFAGHHHSWQRSCPVLNSTCVSSSSVESDLFETAANVANSTAFGTVHIVTGAAGMWCDVLLSPETQPWLVYANTSVHGYARVFVRGDELTAEFVSSIDRLVLDSVTLHRGGRQLGRAPRLVTNSQRIGVVAPPSPPASAVAASASRRPTRRHPPRRDVAAGQPVKLW